MIFTVDSYINDQSAQTAPIPLKMCTTWFDHARQQLYAAVEGIYLQQQPFSVSEADPQSHHLYHMPQGNAHDLFLVYGSTTDLWLTNSGHIYKFTWSTGTFTLIKNNPAR